MTRTAAASVVLDQFHIIVDVQMKLFLYKSVLYIQSAWNSPARTHRSPMFHLRIETNTPAASSVRKMSTNGTVLIQVHIKHLLDLGSLAGTHHTLQVYRLQTE